MNESEFAKRLMEEGPNSANNWEAEVHYNHYGSRGCVDMVETGEFLGDSYINIYELKSDSAIEEVTGANELLRQVKRHAKYFFDGTDDYPRRKYGEAHFFLMFYATRNAVKHVRKNKELYRTAEDRHSFGGIHVSVWHEETGALGITNDEIWENDVRSEELRNLLSMKNRIEYEESYDVGGGCDE